MEKLNDNELFNVCQQTKQDFKNAIEGSKEENNSHDKLILISNEIDRRIFDLKKHMKEKKYLPISTHNQF